MENIIIKTQEEFDALPVVDGVVTIDGDLFLERYISTPHSLSVSGEIHSNGAIYAGGSIEAGGAIKVGRWVESGGWITADGSIEAGEWITADGSIEAGGRLFAQSVEAGGSIEALGGRWVASLCLYYPVCLSTEAMQISWRTRSLDEWEKDGRQILKEIAGEKGARFADQWLHKLIAIAREA